MKKIVRRLGRFSKKEIWMGVGLIFIEVILHFLGISLNVKSEAFEATLQSLQTVASIFVGFYGTMFGIVLTQEVMPIFRRLKRAKGFMQYRWRVWESILLSFLILFGSTILLLFGLNNELIVNISLVVLGIYFVSILDTMWFFVSAVLDTQDELSN